MKERAGIRNIPFGAADIVKEILGDDNRPG